MAEVEFRDVTRRFAGGVVALKGFNLTVADGEFLILVGPSGCGKSTALLQAAFNYEERGQVVLLSKPQIDTKGSRSSCLVSEFPGQ